ncbi:hypothetical protein LJR117_001368 [Acidovorax sp. LjRoot117]
MTHSPVRYSHFPRFEETTLPRCPGCQSERLQAGHLHMGEGAGEFIPAGYKWKFFRASYGVAVHSNQFQMCKDCGLLFRHEDPRALQAYIDRNAKT